MIPHVNESKADLEEDELSHYIEKAQKVKWYHRILLSRILRVMVALIIVTIICPVLIYRYIFFQSLDLPPSDGLSFGSCLVPREDRLPCGIEAVTPEICHEQCCYDLHRNMCFQRYPSRFTYIIHGNWSEEKLLIPRQPTVPYASQKSLANISLSIDEVSATHLSLTFYHSNEIITGRRLEDKKYSYNISQPELNVVVNSTQGNIFNTARGPLIASDNIWEITFKLTEESMYGLGEIPLKADTVKMIYSHEGGMNSIPLIYARSNGSYHGLLIETMAPTEVMVRGGNQLVVRSLTNWGVKFHLFVGPKPVDVMRDVIGVIGAKKSVDYWMLGTHICSEATSSNSATDLQTFISAATTAKLPFDSHCGTAPVVFDTECNSTVVNLINQGATLVRNAGKKFVPHVSPYIRYTELLTPEDEKNETETRTGQRCFDDELFGQYIIRDAESSHLYKGEVDNHDVIYPSYQHATEEFMKSLWIYNSDIDGVVLENNWPLDVSEKEFEDINNDLPYFNENFEAVFNRTPKWNANLPVLNQTQKANTTYPGEKYLYTHNEYGNDFVSAFEKIKGPIPTSTSSQWMNGNVIINRQSIPTSWTSLQKELVEASLGGISGHWYWSSPVCGDTENFNNTTHTRMCAKWYMAATYMPMIKIHSRNVSRDPLAFVGTDRNHMITALNKRMSLLPYFYTILQEGPLLRPMFYQYPSSEGLKDMTTQFSVGDNLLIVPNLQPHQTHVHAWMPPGSWYELWGGLRVDAEEGEAVTMSTTEADFLTLIRGGSIIVTQKDSRLTAELTRLQSKYSLVIALHCESRNSTENETSTIETTTTEDQDISTTIETVHAYNDEVIITTTIAEGDEDEDIISTTEPNEQTITTCHATGKLYMAENMTIIFKANAETLKITAKGEDYSVFCNNSEAIWSSIIESITIYGLDANENNYDDYRVVKTTINLCELQTNNEIVFQFVD